MPQSLPDRYAFRYNLFQLCEGHYAVASQMARRDGVKNFDTFARGVEWKALRKYDGWSQYEMSRTK